jgi:hypothetical protein
MDVHEASALHIGYASRPVDKPFAGRRHEVSRLEGFSDAVFAFALTF